MDECDAFQQAQLAFMNTYRDAPLPLIFKDTMDSHQKGFIITTASRQEEGACQVTFFDRNGFLSHKCGTKEQCLNEGIYNGAHHEPLPKEAYEAITQTASFQRGNLTALYCKSYEDFFSPSAKQIQIDFAEEPAKQSSPEELYCWLYQSAMRKHHVRALPEREGYGANIDRKTRKKLTSEVLQHPAWKKLSQKQQAEGLSAEPVLSKGELSVLQKNLAPASCH